MAGTAVRNTTIIDATGAAPMEQCTVVIGDTGKIVSVGPDGSIDIPQGVEVLDGQGKYVIPGLMDANVHLVSARTPDVLLEFEGRYEDLTLEAAELVLKHGITTVFDSWGPVGPLTTVRDGINKGQSIGARIYCAGNIIGLGGPLSDDFFSAGHFLERQTVTRINEIWEQGTGPRLSSMTAEEVGDRTTQYIEATGIDFVKWASTDHRSGASGVFYMFSDGQQKAIADAAQRQGKTFQAHTTTTESLRLLVDLDATVLQHGDITLDQAISEQLLDTIVEKDLATAALMATNRHLAWSAKTPASAEMHRMRVMADINQRALIARGAKLLLTTDGFAYGPRISNHPGLRPGTLSPETPDLPVQLGYSHLLWMKSALERGMSYMEILRSATSHIADAYAISDYVGTVEPGKVGDLLVLERNPLDDLDAYRKIAHVIKEGAIVNREKLAKNMHIGVDFIADLGL